MKRRRIRAPLLCGLLIAIAMSGPLGAQGIGAVHARPIVVDAGLAAARFRDDLTIVVGPSIQATGGATTGIAFVSGAVGALATAGALSGSAHLQAGVHGEGAHGLGWLLFGEGGSVAGSGTAGGASSAVGSARLVWSGASLGTWVGTDAHVARRPHSTPSGSALAAGAWWRWPRGQLTASVARQRSGAELYTGKLRSAFVGTVPVRYAEATLGMHWEDDRASIDLNGGARRDEGAERLYEPMLSAMAAVWSGDRHAFVFGVSRQLPDFVRGADAADVVSVGMRFRAPSPAAERRSRILPVLQVSDSGGTRMLRVRASGARTVDVMGDFSDWSPVALTASGGAFERAVQLGRGSHHLVVRVDGGPWRPAVNTPSVDDDLGGRVGLLVVP